jgi:hypothetical protein
MAFKTEVNIPVEIALKYQGGMPVTSLYNGKPQVLFTLTNGEQLYVDPEVGERIDALGVVPGEPFGLLKREVRHGVKRSTRFEVYRLDGEAPGPQQPMPRLQTPAPPPQQQPRPRAPQAVVQMMDQGPPQAWEDIPDHALDQQLAASIEQAQERKAYAAAASTVTPMPARRENTVRTAPAPVTTNPQSMIAQVLGNALMAAFDAGQILESYAASRGVAMRMDPDHIKSMAISIFIELQRNSATRQPAPAAAGARPSANGGPYRQ